PSEIIDRTDTNAAGACPSKERHEDSFLSLLEVTSCRYRPVSDWTWLLRMDAKHAPSRRPIEAINPKRELWSAHQDSVQ
ncbi:MAG TPA: hypothetical protein VN952_10595, partial [Chthoniobacterales bacterium]|nr:hypothetical protein [Chthoniobacterales bacterium]